MSKSRLVAVVSGLACLACSTPALADIGDGDAPSKASALAGLTIYVVLLVVGWVLTLFIAFWIIRAGVRGGVRELVEQNRQILSLLQAQTAHLNQLAKGQAGVKADGAGSADDAAAWDKLRNT